MEQLELTLADLDEMIAETGPTDASDRRADRGRCRANRPVVRSPQALPRDVIEHAAPCDGAGACVACGGDAAQIGRGRHRTARLRAGLVSRHPARAPQAVLPRLRDDHAGAGAQPADPTRARWRRAARPCVGGKYCDHLPLHRQAEIYAREDIDLSRSTLADMVGQSARAAAPPRRCAGAARDGRRTGACRRYRRAGARARTGPNPHGAALGLCARRSALRRLRPGGGVYRYTPDRKGEHPRAHLRDFRGILQADGYAGYAGLYGDAGSSKPPVSPTRGANSGTCTRRQNPRSPARRWTGSPRCIGSRHDPRPATRSAPARPGRAHCADDGDLHAWLEATRSRVSGRSDLAGAIRYTLSRWDALTLILRDGRACIDNSAAERAMRPIAVGRRNWTFAGSDAGGERAAAIYSLIETASCTARIPKPICATCSSGSPITRSPRR